MIVFGTTGAFAEMIVIMDPPMVRACPRAPTWQGITQCLVKHGSTPYVVREAPHAKLVQIDQADSNPRDAGVLLYIEEPKQWVLAGLYMQGTTYEVLAFEPITIKQHTGYRIDIGFSNPTVASVDGLSSIQALQRGRLSMFCSGVSWSCSEVVTSCEILVHGNAWWSFHGNVTVGDSKLTVTGDPSVTGQGCWGRRRRSSAGRRTSTSADRSRSACRR